MPYDYTNKRNVFIIFMESFYDYSHFLELFDKDPFPKEYREWALQSSKARTKRWQRKFICKAFGFNWNFADLSEKTKKQGKYRFAFFNEKRWL